MRSAIVVTLKTLYEGREVSASKSLECNTTRVTNEISTLRNSFKIDIITDRINTENQKWYGSYRLVGSDENLKKVRAMLKTYSNQDEVKTRKN